MRTAQYRVQFVFLLASCGLAGCGSSMRQAAPLVEVGPASASAATSSVVTPQPTEGASPAIAAPLADTAGPAAGQVEVAFGYPAATAHDSALAYSAAARHDDALAGRGGYLPTVLPCDEVIGWSRAGTRDDIIIDRIERSDLVFRMTAAEEMRLRQQGISDDVIYAMKESSRR